MWTFAAKELPGRRGFWGRVCRDGAAVTFSDGCRLWEEESRFRIWFNDVLAAMPFAAFRWETPGVTADSAVVSPLEMVVLDSPGLGEQADPTAFAGQFQRMNPGDTVMTFANLGRDALLVVPRPTQDNGAYGHLAAFTRSAPPSQRDALWALVGRTLRSRLGKKPVWLNTAGAGVPWLHVRLDDRPKYYGWLPFRCPPRS